METAMTREEFEDAFFSLACDGLIKWIGKLRDGRPVWALAERCKALVPDGMLIEEVFDKAGLLVGAVTSYFGKEEYRAVPLRPFQPMIDEVFDTNPKAILALLKSVEQHES